MGYPVIDTLGTGKRIKELRLKNHLKVADIRDYLGLESEQAIYKWQRGDCLPTLDNLIALAKMYKTTLDDIVQVIEREDDSPLPFILNNYRALSSCGMLRYKTYTCGLFATGRMCGIIRIG